MAKLDWMRELDEDELKALMEKDVKLVYENCTFDTLIDLLENIAGIQIYISHRSVERAQRFYILQHFNGHNHKELAAHLGCSMDFVYKVMREYHNADDEPADVPDLFETAGGE